MTDVTPELYRQFVYITDDSRFKRSKALQKIKEETVDKLKDFDQDLSQSLFTATVPHLVTALFDDAEKNREVSITILKEWVDSINNITESLAVIIPSITKRLGQQQIVEPSEELRFELSKLLLVLINKSGKINAAYIEEYTSILLQLIVDPYHEVKKQACSCVRAVAKSIPQYFYHKSELFIKPLITGITHQHSRVRTEIIYAIGDVIQHGNGKSVPDVISHLAQRLFDDSPNVRKAVIDIVGNWLLDLTDRYSFHHSLIPLLLTGYTDEIQEIQTLAGDLWYDIGMKYENENESDLKDKLDFAKPAPSHYPPDTERPNLGCRTLIFRTLSRILPGLIRDLSDWVVGTRIKASQLLPFLCINAEDFLTQHAELLLSGIGKGFSDDAPEVRKGLEKAAFITGFFVEPPVWWKLISTALRRGDTGSGLLAGYLFSLSHLVRGSDPVSLVSSGVGIQISGQLAEEEVAHSLVAEVKWQALSSVENLIHCLSEHRDVLQEMEASVFYVIVSTQAVVDPRQASDVTRSIVDKSRSIMQALASATGKTDVHHLYRERMPSLLTTFRASCGHWIAQSANRYVFDTLLLESGPVVGEMLADVIPIFVTCLEKTKDPELRLNLFLLLTKLMVDAPSTLDSQRKFPEYIGEVISSIILPNCQWRSGRTAEAVRRIAATCLWTILSGTSKSYNLKMTAEDQMESLDIQPNVSSKSALSKLSPTLLEEMMTSLMSLMEEDHKGTRMLACRCLIPVLESCQSCLASGDFDRDRVQQLYPALLKRMDDSDDKVRILVTGVMQSWVALVAPNFDVRLYSAHLEDLYAGLLIHLDDPEQDVQSAVYQVLLKAGRLSPGQLEAEIVKVRGKHRSVRLCDKLIDEVKQTV